MNVTTGCLSKLYNVSLSYFRINFRKGYLKFFLPVQRQMSMQLFVQNKKKKLSMIFKLREAYPLKIIMYVFSQLNAKFTLSFI